VRAFCRSYVVVSITNSSARFRGRPRELAISCDDTSTWSFAALLGCTFLECNFSPPTTSGRTIEHVADRRASIWTAFHIRALYFRLWQPEQVSGDLRLPEMVADHVAYSPRGCTKPRTVLLQTVCKASYFLSANFNYEP
jgi:hypothetical protein